MKAKAFKSDQTTEMGLKKYQNDYFNETYDPTNKIYIF
jgi:hypothetical protein